MASPFESAREPVSLEAGERARLDQAAAVSDVTPPAATTEIQPGIDSAARESLSRLALLIRNQLKAVEPTDSEAVGQAVAADERKDETKDEPKEKRDDEEAERKTAEALKERLSAGSGELVSLQAPCEAFPAIVRLARCLERASHVRGSRIYSQQKSKDTVRSILNELERRHAHIELENAHELLIPTHSSMRRAA